MKSIVDTLVDFAKKLPGFGLVLLIATVGYTYLKADDKEPSVWATFATASVCWLLYRASACLDKLYDKIYGPKSTLTFPWGIQKLRSSRNEAAKAIFQPVDARVHDYASATARGHIGDKPLPSLYSLCSSAAKSTEVWQHRIGRKIDVSKAARTVFVFAVLALVITAITPVRELTKADPYIQRLGFLAQPWFECTLALVALVAYVALRVQHNVELFDYVAKNVTHLPVKGKTAAIVFDVVLSHDAPSDDSN